MGLFAELTEQNHETPWAVAVAMWEATAANARLWLSRAEIFQPRAVNKTAV